MSIIIQQEPHFGIEVSKPFKTLQLQTQPEILAHFNIDFMI